MRVLIVGDQRSKARFDGFENVEFFDNPDPEQGGPYDYIVLDHLLNQAKRPQVFPIVKMYSDYLVDGGQLALVVPSLEWACTEIATNDEPNPMAYLSIYGTDVDQNLSGMTILWMRIVLEQCGLFVVQAKTEQYKAAVNDQPFEARQNVVIAMRLNIDPSNAFTTTETSLPVFTE